MSLVAWYPLISNGNNQGLDGKNLETVGTVTYTAGKLGNAATFSANLSNYLRRPQPKLYNNFSFACWYKLNSTDSTTWQQLFACGRDNSDGWGFRINGSNKRVVFHCGNVQYTYGTDLTIGTWHHVCMVIKDSIYTAYVDGVAVNSANITTLPALTEWGTYFFVGCLSNNYYPLNGQIQDIRIYDHPLSVKEVKELAKGLCVYIPLDWGANPNLQPNSNIFGTTAGNPNNFTHETKVYDGQNVIRMTCKTDSYSGGPYRAGFTKGTLAVVGKTYTWSMYIRANSSFTMNTVGHECGGTRSVSVTPEWQYVTHTWTVTDGTYQAWVFYGRTWALGDWIEVKNFKVEEGSVATPYIPNTAETLYTEKQYAKKFAEDCSGYNRELSILSAPTNGGTSVRGITCTHFDGSDDGVSFTDSTFYNQIANANTVAFWINSEDAGDRSVYFSHYAGSGWSMAFEKTTSNTLRLYWNGNPDYTNSSFTITDGEWIHIAIVRESATSTKFYKNGSLVNTYTTTCANPTSGASIYYLGRDVRTGVTCYKGYMSDFRFYATALTANDIKELYNVGASIDKSGKIYCGSLIEV